MGLVYRVANDDAREVICPQLVDDLSGKMPGTAAPGHPFGNILLYLMGTFWNGSSCRLVNDEGDQEEFYGYTNITEKVIAAYNEQFRTNHKFTPG